MKERYFAWLVVGFFLGLYLWLLVGIPNTPAFFSTPVWQGVNVGQMLVLALHVLSVVAAWIYIYLGQPEAAEDNGEAS